MKKIFIITGVAVFMISIFTGCFRSSRISSIKSFHFWYTTGNMVNSDVSYDLEYKNGAYRATIKPDGVQDNKAVKKKVDTEFADSLKAILEKYKVGKWNGFNKTNSMVMDGNSFTLDISMDEGDISAHGYMSWPSGYADFKEEVITLFESIQ